MISARPTRWSPRVLGIVPQPLWVLAVYLVLLTLTPWLRRLVGRFALAVPALLLGAVALVDLARFGAGIGWPAPSTVLVAR